MFNPFITSSWMVGSVYSPFVIAQAVVEGVQVSDFLTQAPVVGLLVIVVGMFLKHIRETETARIAAHVAAEKARSESIEKMGDKCHQVQEKSIETMESMRTHMEREAEIRGKTLEVIDRLGKHMDQAG